MDRLRPKPGLRVQALSAEQGAPGSNLQKFEGFLEHGFPSFIRDLQEIRFHGNPRRARFRMSRPGCEKRIQSRGIQAIVSVLMGFPSPVRVGASHGQSLAWRGVEAENLAPDLADELIEVKVGAVEGPGEGEAPAGTLPSQPPTEKQRPGPGAVRLEAERRLGPLHEGFQQFNSVF